MRQVRVAVAALLVAALAGVAAPSAADPVAHPPASTLLAGVDLAPTGGLLTAAIAADFDPGNIISDTVFFDPGTMSVSQVQQFLDDRGRNCRPGTPACLKDIRVTTVAKAADAYCAGYTGGLSQSAAEIIVGAARSCGVNPRVLIVLLEKEQSLVTRTRPTTSAYERATGFGCPDTAPCNAEFFGLFNQLYLAARQYQRYANPSFPTAYKPGRTVNVLFHPNTACGSAPVHIANQATAGLYAYTPYQPNAAALANLYGTGDACSAYGNRNFWRLFTDWFGSTQGGGFLVRTADNATVYLVSGSAKYPIASMAILGAYAPLGPVGFVSQMYLDRRTTGQLLDRFVHAPDGTVYFVDQGRKYHFGTCTQVADFGGNCGSLVPLTEVQIAALSAGGPMRATVKTTNGKTFYVTQGTKREAADDASLTAAGMPTSAVALSEASLAQLSYGDPFIRDGIVIRDRGTGQDYLASSAGINPVPQAMLTATRLDALPARSLDRSSVARLSTGGTLSPFVRTTSGAAVLLRGASLTELSDATVLPSTLVTVGPESLAAFTPTGAVGAPLFVQPVGQQLRYQIVGGTLLPVRDDAELAFLGGTAENVLRVTAGVASLLPVGADAVATQFTDVRLTHRFAADILWLAASKITSGYADGTFRPYVAVSRQAMAAFIYRTAGSPAFTPPVTPSFADVRSGHTFYREIEWLAAEGITTGTTHPDGTLRFDPDASVSRQAMAAFLYRFAGSPAFTPPSTPTFSDVGPSNQFFVQVEWLASVGITTGTAQPDGSVRFLPATPVSRQAMAAFLHRFTAL